MWSLKIRERLAAKPRKLPTFYDICARAKEVADEVFIAAAKRVGDRRMPLFPDALRGFPGWYFRAGISGLDTRRRRAYVLAQYNHGI
jgi:hypothetical protein